MTSLTEWYRANGESAHVPPVEAALDPEQWLGVNDLALRSGKSAAFVRQVCDYLVEVGRAEHTTAPLKRPMYGVRERHVYRARCV